MLQEFLQNVRLAASFLDPKVQTDHPDVDAEHLKNAVTDASLWLTPKAVEGFDLSDFDGSSKEDLRLLKNSVADFRKAAEHVSSSGAATPDQVKQAALALSRILKIVQYPETREVTNLLGQMSFPPFARGYDIELGNDWSGDPAMWLWLVVDPEAPETPSFRSDMENFRISVHEAFRKARLPWWPYLRIRIPAEQGSLIGAA